MVVKCARLHSFGLLIKPSSDHTQIYCVLERVNLGQEKSLYKINIPFNRETTEFLTSQKFFLMFSLREPVTILVMRMVIYGLYRPKALQKCTSVKRTVQNSKTENSQFVLAHLTNVKILNVQRNFREDSVKTKNWLAQLLNLKNETLQHLAACNHR